jgi:hypothetical protein
MPRQKKRSDKSSKKRVTFVIPPALDLSIEMRCAATGRLKNEVATVAIAEFLGRHRAEIEKVVRETITEINAL